MKPLLLLLAMGCCLGRLTAQIDLSIFDGTGVEASEEETPDAEEAGDPDADGGEAAAETGAETTSPDGMTGEGEAPPGEAASEPAETEGDEEESLLPGGPLVPEGDGDPEDEEAGETGALNGDPAAEEASAEEEAASGFEEVFQEEAMPDLGPEAEEPGEAARGGRATEVFRPTERIPADQSVDFPWDI